MPKPGKKTVCSNSSRRGLLHIQDSATAGRKQDMNTSILQCLGCDRAQHGCMVLATARIALGIFTIAVVTIAFLLGCCL